MKHAVAELLPFYLNGTLDDAARARVESELASCAQCAAELEELRGLAQALQARAAAVTAPAALAARTFARLGAPAMSSRDPEVQRPWWSTPARYAAAASLVVGIGAGVAAWHSHVAGGGSAQPGSQTVSVLRLPAPATPAPMPPPKMKIDSPARTRSMQGIPQGQETASSRARRLAKRAQLELLVDDVERALTQARSAVVREGGTVTALTDATPRSDDVVHGATLDAEVPADRLDATLDALAALGTMRNKTVAAEDVDGAIVDEEARLTNLRREERDLRTLMDRGGKLGDVLAVQQSLADVRGQIEQLDAQHAHDLHRVATSTIALALTERTHAAAPPGAGQRILDAWRDGARSLLATIVDVASSFAWLAGYAPGPLTLAGATYALTLALRRRWAR